MAEEIGKYFTLLDVPPRSSGTFSIIRKAVDRRDGHFVAVKFITGQRDDLGEKVFERESKSLQNLSHANILRCLDAGIDETGTHYLVLDWVEKNLDDVLKESGPWESWDRFAGDVALPLIDALSYTHLNGIEHRDIKPQNVLMTDSGNPLLADFGIAKIRGDGQPTTATVGQWHSRPYAPPLLNEGVRFVRDVYAMGVLILQCLTEASIRDFDDVERAVETVKVPPEVRRVLATCVATDPHDRPSSASDLLGALVTIQHGRRSKSVSRQPIWLRLTKTAIRALAGDEDSIRAAVAVAQADLSGDTYANFLPDKETGAPDRGTIRLDGDSWSFLLKPDSDGAVVIGAANLDFERLESHRRRALALPRIYDWMFSKPPNVDAVRRALATLIDSIDAFYVQADLSESEPVGVTDETVFDTWLRVLNAREELARGEKRPLPYKKWKAKGREATFTLEEAPEQDLVGTEWRAKDRWTDRKFGWGEVIGQEDDRLVVLSARRWEGLPDRGTLIPHLGPDEVSLNRQRQAVQDIRNSKSARSDLRELLIDPGKNSAPAETAIDQWSRDLDESKKKAIQLALGASDMFVVEGPPGTGKTSLIAELVEQYLRKNPSARVLIASQTNVAVDNALERLSRTGQQNMVRLSAADITRVDESVRHLLLDAQMKRWAHGVRKRAEQYLGGKASAAGATASHLRAALSLQQLLETLNQLRYLQNSRPSIDDEPEPSTLTAELVEPSPSTSVQERVDALMDLRDELIQDAQRELAGDLTLTTDMSAADAKDAIDALVGRSDAAHALLEQLRLQGEWLQRIASDSALATTFLNQTNVIGGTCIGFLRHSAVKQLDIDVCILDEASRATLTEALVPISRAKRWVIVGDTKQLPPIDEDLLRSPEILKENQILREDVEETLFQRLTHRLPENSRLMLTQQYRMISPIGDLISTCFYGEELVSPRSRGLDGYVMGYGKPVLWIDTSPLGEWRREAAPQGQTTSYANRAEARVIADRLRILNGAIAKGVIALSDGIEKLDVLVIAPYLSQVAELKQQVAVMKHNLPHLSLTVMSVDAVQGRESDVALFSVTRSNTAAKLGFLGPEYWRRINVALSRARFGLTIVGDAGFIKGTTGALKNVLTYIESHPDDCEIRYAEPQS